MSENTAELHDSEVVSEHSAKPFLKWVGGKSQLLVELTQRKPLKYKRYFEPFIGGGAFFLRAPSEGAYLSDVNSELINAYLVVRDSVEKLIEDLGSHRYEEEYYYTIRALDRAPNFSTLSPVKRASRLIFLNKTCFNGLYRVNSSGYFNVPFGSYKNPRILDAENLRACSKVLQAAEIQCASFLKVEELATPGDFVYFDPPYIPLNTTSSFTTYSQDGFGEGEQVALRDLCRRLNDKGVHFMLSNSSAPQVHELYKEFSIETVQATRAINSNASKRGVVEEVIVRNYRKE